MIHTIKYRILKFFGFKTEDEVEWEEEHATEDAIEDVITTDKIMKDLINQMFWYREYDNTYHPHKPIFYESEIEIYLSNAKLRLLQIELRRASK